jgi:hypothetical protein
MRKAFFVFALLTTFFFSVTANAITAIGPQKTAVILVKFDDSTIDTLTEAQTRDQIRDRVFTQLNTYLYRSSYGKTWLEGDVFGDLSSGTFHWYHLNMLSVCDFIVGNETLLPTTLTRVLAAALEKAGPDIDFQTYRRIVIVREKPTGYYGDSCFVAGTIGPITINVPNQLSTVGTVLWIDLVTMDQGVGTAPLGKPALPHEFGHNLGLYHARAYDCVSTAFSSTGCGDGGPDPYDTMNNAPTYLADYNAFYRKFLGWLELIYDQDSVGSGSYVLDVRQSGPYTILPLNTSGPGIKALQIRRQGNPEEAFYVEYRQPDAYSTVLPGSAYSGALIHHVRDLQKAESGLLDSMPESTVNENPDDFLDAALTLNKSLTDGAGVTVTTISVSPTALTVQVKMPCTMDYPITQVQSLGDGTGATNEEVKVTFTGNVANAAAIIAKPNTNSIYICPGTTVSYTATTTKGTLVCKVNNTTTRPSGTLRVNDNLQCTNKPGGSDVDKFFIKGQVSP